MTRAVVLFTRDLRVRDHQPLARAVREHDEVIPVFVLEPTLLARSCGSPNRLAFLLDCLRDLDGSLRERGARLQLARGDVVREALRTAQRWQAEAVYMTADSTPYAAERHRRLGDAALAARIALRTFPGTTILAPGQLTPLGGTHYRVFTPYWRAWSRVPLEAPTRTPPRITVPPGLPDTPIPELRSLVRTPPSPSLGRGGETEARRRLQRWLRGGLANYGSLRDGLAVDGTSRLSADLHFGCLSARELLSRSSPGGAAAEFARQLCWRDFHHQVIAARPDLPSTDYRSRGDRWREDADALAAWRAGLTGFPIVDAGMRQLSSEGFIHNRARLIVASFLAKTLYVDWRAGAAHFARLLVDADVANNVGNWQWVAGTGNDTRPNRVLNPLRGAARFDPRGEYVRRHVPELAGIEGADAHEPWRLPARARRGLAYPPPLLDLSIAAERLRRTRYASRSPS